MTRLQENRDRVNKGKKWQGLLCPKINHIIEKNVDKASQNCIPYKSRDAHYVVECYNDGRYTVDIPKQYCSCRKWQLNSIPFQYVVSVLQF